MGSFLVIQCVGRCLLVRIMIAVKVAIRGRVVTASCCRRRSILAIVGRRHCRRSVRVAWIQYLLVRRFVPSCFLVVFIDVERLAMLGIARLVWPRLSRSAGVGHLHEL